MRRTWLWKWLLVVCLAAVCGSAFAADITIRVRIPAGITPTIVTDTDNSGVYKFFRIGQTAYRLVNFDANLSVKRVQDPTRAGPETTIILGGANGPDPLPTVTVVWLQTGLQPNMVTLGPGQSTTCTGCDVTIRLN